MRRWPIFAEIDMIACQRDPCTVAMEACCGAHHMGRALAGMGHAVRLMSPEYVSPYVKVFSRSIRGERRR